MIQVNITEAKAQFTQLLAKVAAGEMRRSAVSVPSNIAEGEGRMTCGERRSFLGHARGSLYELETQAHPVIPTARHPVIPSRNVTAISPARAPASPPA